MRLAAAPDNLKEDCFFDRLEEGDHFLLHVLDETLSYEVDQILTVEPDETDALAVEANDGTAAEAYANVVAVKEGNENSEAIQALVKALESEEVRAFIEETYQGAVMPLF